MGVEATKERPNLEHQCRSGETLSIGEAGSTLTARVYQDSKKLDELAEYTGSNWYQDGQSEAA